MGFDLERFCCNSPSSSSSTDNIFCNENYNKCSQCCCYSCCKNSFLNDHTYSILKRVCHKIIKNYNRQQCREKYTIFNGGNSINSRWSERQKGEELDSSNNIYKRKDQADKSKLKLDEKSCKEREVGEKIKKGKDRGENEKDQGDKSKLKLDEKYGKEREVGEKNKKAKDRGENEKDDYAKMGKDRGDTRAKKDADESDPLKKLKKPGSGGKEDNIIDRDKNNDESNVLKKSKKRGSGRKDDKAVDNIRGKNEANLGDSLKKSKRAKKDADESNLAKKSKIPGAGERDDKITDDSFKSERARGREKKIGTDLKNARPSIRNAEKENGKKGKEKISGTTNKKGKQTPLNETDLNAKPEIEKKGKNTKDEKGQVEKYKQAEYSAIERKKFDRKSKNLNKNGNINIDAKESGRESSLKRKNRKSLRDTTGVHEKDRREPDKDRRIRSSRRSGQNIRNRKSGRLLSRGNSRSRLGKGIKGSKFIQDMRSNENESYSRRPSRGDEVRTCDILRVHLEKRDLLRCIPNECQVCGVCIHNCKPCPRAVC